MAYREGLSVRLFFHLYLCLEAGVSGESGEIRHRSTMVGDGSADCDLRSPKVPCVPSKQWRSGLRRPVIVAPESIPIMSSVQRGHEQLSEVAAGDNTWATPGTAAYDFCSDVRTSPTPAMLQAVTHASLLDDIERSDSSTKKLEEYVASLTGHEAGLWVVSGTMSNLVALRSLLVQPPYSILCDNRAHCLTTEAGGIFAFAGAVSQAVNASNGKYLTLEDILPHVRLGHGEKVHTCPTRVISLENTLRGMVMPLEETRRICDFAHENGIKVHLDGARLWEVVTSGAGTLSEYCALFDTVTMCFTKGLGAPAGAVMVGSQDVVRQARWIRQSIGGSIRQPGMLAEAAYVAVKETFEGGRLAGTHQVAAHIAREWESGGGKLKHPTDTNMVWLDFDGESFGLDDLIRRGRERGIYVHRDRIVVHYRQFLIYNKRDES